MLGRTLARCRVCGTRGHSDVQKRSSIGAIGSCKKKCPRRWCWRCERRRSTIHGRPRRRRRATTLPVDKRGRATRTSFFAPPKFRQRAWMRFSRGQKSTTDFVRPIGGMSRENAPMILAYGSRENVAGRPSGTSRCRGRRGIEGPARGRVVRVDHVAPLFTAYPTVRGVFLARVCACARVCGRVRPRCPCARVRVVRVRVVLAGGREESASPREACTRGVGVRGAGLCLHQVRGVPRRHCAELGGRPPASVRPWRAVGRLSACCEVGRQRWMCLG